MAVKGEIGGKCLGFEAPVTVTEALRISRVHKMSSWKDALQEHWPKVRVCLPLGCIFGTSSCGQLNGLVKSVSCDGRQAWVLIKGTCQSESWISRIAWCQGAQLGTDWEGAFTWVFPSCLNMGLGYRSSQDIHHDTDSRLIRSQRPCLHWIETLKWYAAVPSFLTWQIHVDYDEVGSPWHHRASKYHWGLSFFTAVGS